MVAQKSVVALQAHLGDLPPKAGNFGKSIRVLTHRHLKESQHAEQYRAACAPDPKASATMETGDTPSSYDAWVEA
eukprot:3373996-Alexandrium_andersonii.AAC.1